MPNAASRLLCCIVTVTVLAPFSVADEIVTRKVTKADMPRIPATEPHDALSTFKLPDGWTLEMVASEPMVSDPVDACFDESGRMFIAEMHGYPFSQEPTKLNPTGGGKVNAGIIRMLEDTDGDGVMDRSEVFADGISWPTSVCCYNGGIFVVAPEFLYFFKDTTGDGKADLKEVILSGFGRGNVQGLTNGLQWGLDNRIYFAAGRNPIALAHRGKKIFDVRGADLSFNPKAEDFKAVSGGLQFGHSKDDWGVRFVCSNSNHIQQVVFPRGYLSRNPFFAAPAQIRSIATDGASARVFRRSPPEPWRIIRQKWRAADKGYRLVINDDGGWEFIPADPSKKAGVVPTEYPVGYFTSATGVTIYRGNAYPNEFRGNAFVGDVGGNLVHRKTVKTDEVVYSATRADQGEEIIASTDNWFRPVNFVNAPDGCIYVLDMYRETIEHPHSIPEEIKRFCDLTSGHDRGRIYRLLSPEVKRNAVKNLGALDTAGLVAELASPNAWNRDTAQRLLWERQDPDVVRAVAQLLVNCAEPRGRLHALWTLHGLNALNATHVKAALEDDHPRVRAHGIKLAETFLQTDAEFLEHVAPLANDVNPHVRFQLAFSLGEAVPSSRVASSLARLVGDDRTTNEIQVAAYSSASKTAPIIVEELLKLPPSSNVTNAVAQLGQIIGSNPDQKQAVQLIKLMVGWDAQVQHKVLNELGRGLSRRGVSFAATVKGDKTAEQLIQNVFQSASSLAVDGKVPLKERRLAITMLGFADDTTGLKLLPQLLTSSTPQELQLAAVQALGSLASREVSSTLLQNWESLTPTIRRETVNVLTNNTARTTALLSAVESGTVKRGDIERTVKQQLMSHRDKTIAGRSKKLFGDGVSTNRSKVVADYQNVLELSGDAGRGREVFKKTCSVCHRVGDLGHKVAPDLASVKNKSEADLLISILDPNREAQPNFNVYTVVTNQGRTYNGIIASESSSSITLRRAEAKEDVLLRSNVDEMVATGLSLMPEGLEKDLTPQQIADVITFVKTIGKN